MSKRNGHTSSIGFDVWNALRSVCHTNYIACTRTTRFTWSVWFSVYFFVFVLEVGVEEHRTIVPNDWISILCENDTMSLYYIWSAPDEILFFLRSRYVVCDILERNFFANVHRKLWIVFYFFILHWGSLNDWVRRMATEFDLLSITETRTHKTAWDNYNVECAALEINNK